MAESPKTGLAGKHVRGIAGSFEGLRFLCSRPTLWRYAVWPILINIAVSLASLFVAYQAGSHFWQSYADSLPIAWWATIVKWCLFLKFVLVVALRRSRLCRLPVAAERLLCVVLQSDSPGKVDLFLGTRPRRTDRPADGGVLMPCVLRSSWSSLTSLFCC